MKPFRALSVLLACSCGTGPSLRSEEPPRALTQGAAPLAGILKAGEANRFTLRLEQGQFARVVVMQKGVDVVVTALAPGGAKLAEVDSPNGSEGPEPVDLQARETGTYTVVVQSLEPKAEPGAYDVRIETFMTAEQFRREGIVEVPLPDLLACGGVFELAPGHVVTTGVLAEIGHKLVFTDHRTGRVGALHSHSSTEYFLGANLLSPKPLEARLRFLKGVDGQVTALEIEDPAGKVRTARRVGPARAEEVVFQNEGLTLKGTLHLPPGKGPFPALVYAHGSGPATRHSGTYPAYFTSLGFAVLAFDKRGAGQSQGDWRTSSFHSLAADVVAAVALLKGRADIDARRLGVYGTSQGGWVGSLAAASSKDIRFFLAIVGSGVPVWENVAHETTSVMKTFGLPAADLEEGRAFARKAFRLAADGAGPEAVAAAAEPHKGKAWLSAVWIVGLAKENPWWTWWKLNGHVDPMAVLPKIACPVLWVLGDRDSQVPTVQSEPRIREALAKGGNRDVLLRVFPRGSHSLLECETGLLDELPSLSRFVPGYFDALAAWLKQRPGK